MPVKKHVWPAVRTVGIGLVIAMMPVIYMQIHEDAKEQRKELVANFEDQTKKLQIISQQVVNLELAITPWQATTDQKYTDLDYRVKELETYKPVYRK